MKKHTRPKCSLFFIPFSYSALLRSRLQPPLRSQASKTTLLSLFCCSSVTTCTLLLLAFLRLLGKSTNYLFQYLYQLNRIQCCTFTFTIDFFLNFNHLTTIVCNLKKGTIKLARHSFKKKIANLQFNRNKQLKLNF